MAKALHRSLSRAPWGAPGQCELNTLFYDTLGLADDSKNRASETRQYRVVTTVEAG